MQVEINLLNVEEFRERMEKASEESRKAIGKVVASAALSVESGAKRRCPVDTGRLRASIHTEIEDEFKATVGTDVEYGPYVEFGTVRMAAQPFLFPAVEEVFGEGSVEEELRRQIEAALEE